MTAISSTRRSARGLRRLPGAAWIAGGCVLVVHALAIGWPPTLALATLLTAFAVVLLVSSSIAYVHFLGWAERAARKRAPVRLLSIALSFLVFRMCVGGDLIIEPGLIAVPLDTWIHVASDLMLGMPIVITIADVLGHAMKSRGTVATRIAVISTVCGLCGLSLAAYLLSTMWSADAPEFDRMVAGPALGAIVLAATAGIAMRASRIALAEPPPAAKSDAGYRIVRPIASGGMGEVWLAERVGPHGFHRSVVLKRILEAEENDPLSIERFLDEARIAASLQHPNIVAVNDLGRLDDTGWFLAMEYLAGLTARELITLLARCAVDCPADALASIGLQACRGLGHAHGQGVVHRDISPHNLMITFEGVVKVLDFGVAKMKGATREIRTGAAHGALTRDGVIVGKVAYLAPEQFRGLPASQAGDVFGLGVALYEVATGSHPYNRAGGKFPVGETAEDRIPLCERRADLPLPLCIAIDRAVAYDPWNRWRSAGELADALTRARPDTSRFDLGAWLKSFAPPDADSLTPPTGTATLPFAIRHAAENG